MLRVSQSCSQKRRTFYRTCFYPTFMLFFFLTTIAPRIREAFSHFFSKFGSPRRRIHRSTFTLPTRIRFFCFCSTGALYYWRHHRQGCGQGGKGGGGAGGGSAAGGGRFSGEEEQPWTDPCGILDLEEEVPTFVFMCVSGFNGFQRVLGQRFLRKRYLLC